MVLELLAHIGMRKNERHPQPWIFFFTRSVLPCSRWGCRQTLHWCFPSLAGLQFSSVAQLCLTLCDPMDGSTPGLPVHHQLPEFIWWCHPTISSSVIPLSCLQSFPMSGSFPMNRLFASEGQSIQVSALASVLPMNFQNWFLLELTGLIPLQSKELSRVFSNTIVQKHQFFGIQTFLLFNSHIHTWLLEKP